MSLYPLICLIFYLQNKLKKEVIRNNLFGKVFIKGKDNSFVVVRF